MPERDCWSSSWREFLIANLSNCRVGDGNQGADTADRPLEPHGAPSILLFPQSLN
jgi:hypothetical protein